MARKRQLQTTFIAGELAPELALRVDTKQYVNGAKSLLNRRCLIGGGTSRRPGTRDLNTLGGFNARLVEFVFTDNDQLVIAFSWSTSFGGLFICYLPDGTFQSSFGGAPWDTVTMREMDFMQSGNTIIVTHASFAPRVITRISNFAWTFAPIQFFTSGPRLEQPYFKIAPLGITMQPSAPFGSILITLSLPGWFQPGHAGTRVRYLGREILITSVSDPTTAFGNVLERLPGTFDVTVEDGSGFTIDETVLGADSGAKGVISAVSGNVLTIYLRQASITSPSGPGGATSSFDAGLILGFPGVSNEFLGFGAAQPSLTPFTIGEILVGPVFTSKVTASAVAAQAAVRDWDEALFTDLNGYPSCVALHRNRLCFSGHPKAPNLFLASRIGNIYSFNVGDASDADAIAVTIGDAAAAEIRQMYSSDQLVLGTDKGLYYVPEGTNSPFRPTSMAFVAFGSPWPISGSCKMRAFDDGIIAVSGSTVIKARGTGDSNKTWVATEMSILSPHLLRDPYDMAVTTNFENGPERYCVFSNTDGTLAVMMLVEGQDIRNFVPWVTQGFFGSVCVVRRRLYVAAARIGSNFRLELFDNALTLDGTRDFATEAQLVNVPALYPGLTVNVVTVSGFSLGTYPLTMDDVPPGPFRVGQNYPTIIETLPAVVEDARGSNAGEFSKISEALVFTHESARFTGNGYEKTAYRINEDANLPPPKRTGPQRLTFLGWRRSPTLVITQPDPLPLTILSIKTEVLW